MSYNTYPLPSLSSTSALRPRLPIKRLCLMISVTLLLNACSSVYETANDDESDMLTSRMVGDRSIAARVSISSDAGNTGSEEQAFSDIWSRIGAGLQFTEQYDNRRIEEQLDFYKANPNFLKTVTERSSPFIYAIVEEVERRGLPTELALLPIVESAFNPNAVSPGNSVGLWQIGSSTAPTLGLKRDWWYDGSRDPLASTAAALDYLTQLNQMFDESWLLSLAAYNTGPGNVRKAIDRNSKRERDVDYWSLNLPSVTQDFVPKLIALSRLIANPDHYGIELAQVPNEPVVSLVEVGFQLDLALAASIAELEPQTLYQLNPGFRQWATHPDGPYSLLLPVGAVETFKANLQEQSRLSDVTWDRYVVQNGDSLGKIARQFRTQVSVLQQVNDLDGSKIIAGESLLIPRAYSSANPLAVPNAPLYSANASTQAEPLPPQAPARYRVRSGDSLWGIANRYKLSVADLTQWNKLSSNAVIKPGQELILQAESTLAQTSSRSTKEEQKFYVVRTGDSLARIASRFGLTAEQLATWNGIKAGDLIHPGQQLLLNPSSVNIN